MEKRLLLALALSVLILLAWTWLNPPAQQPAPQPAPAGPVEPAPAPVPAVAEPPETIEEEAVEAAEPQEVRLETERFEIVLTSRGGRVASWRLRDYKAADGSRVEIVPSFAAREGMLPLALDLGDEALSRRANEALYVVERERLGPEDGGEGERVRFTWADGRGRRFVKALVFRPRDGLVDIEIQAKDRGRALPARVVWGPGLEVEFSAAEAKGQQLYYTGQAVWNIAGQVTRKARHKVEAELAYPEGVPLLWAGVEDQYFAALILPRAPRSGFVIRPVPIVRTPAPVGSADGKAPKPEPQVSIAVAIPPEGAQLYVGAKKYGRLRELGHDLEAVVWFSDYPLVAWCAKGLFLALVWIHDHVVPNYGLAIILATLGLRLALFPLNQYSMVGMKKMQVQMQRLQPKINAIKNRYRKQKDAESRRKMNEELMALYRKEGVNPMGGVSGCLPLLAQFPILIAFYDMLTVAVELRGAPFLGWIRDLSRPDPIWITPILMGATMLWQQRMAMTKTTDPQQRQQQMIMMFLPLVFTATFVVMPSGLVLYWLFNNVLGIAQQWLVNRHVERVAAALQKA